MFQAKYLGDEAKEKSAKNIDANSWDMEFVEDLPQQQNGYVLALSQTLCAYALSSLLTVNFFLLLHFFYSLGMTVECLCLST